MPNPRFMQTAGRWMNRDLPVERVAEPEETAELEPAIFSIDDILNGETFYSDKKDGNNYVGLPIALQEALKHSREDGMVATMPELIAAKAKADKSHEFWKKWYTVHTEENIGIDKKGRFYTRNEPVLIIVNGGGILTPDRIRQAYNEGLVNHSAKYTEDEFNGLLEGKLPDGSSLALYPYEDIEKGVSNLLHRFGIVMPYQTAKETSSGYHKKRGFLENPLAIARNGGRENLEGYYEKARNEKGDLGNWHVYGKDRDPTVPQGRLLFLSIDYGGLYGNNNLDNNGWFVGVAPEARSARN